MRSALVGAGGGWDGETDSMGGAAARIWRAVRGSSPAMPRMRRSSWGGGFGGGLEEKTLYLAYLPAESRAKYKCCGGTVMDSHAFDDGHD